MTHKELTEKACNDFLAGLRDLEPQDVNVYVKYLLDIAGTYQQSIEKGFKKWLTPEQLRGNKSE